MRPSSPARDGRLNRLSRRKLDAHRACTTRISGSSSSLRPRADVQGQTSRLLVCRERSIVRDDGGRFTTPPPSRLEARSLLGDKAANELGAPVVSSIPAQLPGPEPASARKGRASGACGGDQRSVTFSNAEMAVTIWAGAKGLCTKVLFGTPCAAHSWPPAPVM